MAVEDAALWRQEGGVALQVRLKGPRLGGRQDLHALDVIGPRLIENGVEPVQLFRAVEDHKLAAAVEGDSSFGQEGVEGPPALDAEPRLQGTCRVVQPAMDDLGVPGGDALADPGTGLKHDCRETTAGQGEAAGEPYGARPDDNGVEVEFRHV